MYKGSSRSNYRPHFRRHRVLIISLALIVVVLFLAKPASSFVSAQYQKSAERKELKRAWKAKEFDIAYSMSKTALEHKPTDYFLLTVNGFSAFQMGISQINSSDTLHYIDECIWSLRKAIQLKNAEKDGGVYYVLGKAYCYKGDDYAELAVEYLEKARSLSFDAAGDIYEYLGLAYAAIGDYRSSVEAFSGALSPTEAEPADKLLLAIAKSYTALDESETAKAYLLRCMEISRDSRAVVTARLQLAEILSTDGNAEEAQQQYFAILETEENAEAHYQLGEIYARQGDTTRARSEWRLAVRADPAHQKAREKLNI